MKFNFLLFITFIFPISISHARICYSTGSGNWGTASTWTCPGGPAAGDTIYILAGHTVTIASTVTYSGSPMYIIIEGTLHFNNGRKLRLPCGSGVRTIGSGQITADGYTGNSENIEICNVVVWQASDGPVTSPTNFGTPFSPLPISLLSFSGKQKNSSIYITWITSSEVNNDYYSLEHAIDGENFNVVKILKGAGFSNEILYYNYLHEKPVNGINYYRLKQTDYDGTFTYSDIIAVNFKQTYNSLLIYPNPISNNQFTVSGLSENEMYQITLCDLNGRIINTLQSDFENEITFYFDKDLTKGFYFVIVQSPSNTDIIKLSVN